jgi:hypothetical protein
VLQKVREQKQLQKAQCPRDRSTTDRAGTGTR